MSRPGGALLRLLGADPETFRPLYRVQRLLIDRGARIVQGRRRGALAKSSPFGLLCLFSLLYGLIFTAMLAVGKSPLLGAAVVLTVGGLFLFLLVITDHADLLVSSRDALLLGAYPHDGRSFLLAKVAALGWMLGIVGGLLFIPSAIASGLIWRSWLASLAFLAGAAGVWLAAPLSGLLLGAVIFRAGGRGAIDRLLPWLQGIFQIGYLFVVGGQRLLRMVQLPPDHLGALPWLLPSFWFLAPLEMLERGIGAASLGRLALALGTVVFLLAGATRWLGTGLSERLTEPPPAARRSAKRRRPLAGGGSERARLFSILRVHLRSDWRTRSEFLLIPLMGAFMILFYFRDLGGPASFHGITTFIYAFMLVLSGDVLTRSTRPESLWWVLTAPVDRARFSWGTLLLVRLFQLLPLFLASAVVEIRLGGSWPARLAVLAELLALGDLLVILGKGIFPDFPFSRPRGESGGTSTRLVLNLLGGLVSGVVTLLVFLLGLLGPWGALAGAAGFALLRFPATYWARRRTAVAAEGLELGGSWAGARSRKGRKGHKGPKGPKKQQGPSRPGP